MSFITMQFTFLLFFFLWSLSCLFVVTEFPFFFIWCKKKKRVQEALWQSSCFLFFLLQICQPSQLITILKLLLYLFQSVNGQVVPQNTGRLQVQSIIYKLQMYTWHHKQSKLPFYKSDQLCQWNSSFCCNSWRAWNHNHSGKVPRVHGSGASFSGM